MSRHGAVSPAGSVPSRAWPETREFDTIAASFPWVRDARGVGDDAARVGRRGLLCCDALCEGVHFRRDWSSMADVGWKAVAQNVADILAMGGQPTEGVWSVGLGRDWSAQDFRRLALGATQACEHYGCRIVGGDTVRTTGPGFVSLSLSGTLRARPWLRSGARVGDDLVLAGSLGLSAAGLALFQNGLPKGTPSLALRRHRRPEPPSALVAGLFERNILVHAAIDISDGLSSECHHLSLASGVGLQLFLPDLPRAPALLRSARILGVGPESWLLDGGEEHSLLLAVPSGQSLPDGLRRIGRFVPTGGVVVRDALGNLEALAPGGWSHG